MTNRDQIWRDQFSSQYYQHTGRLPVIQWGRDPAHDVAVVEHIGPGREYWMMYALDDYNADYWAVFLALFQDQPRFSFNISTAIILTERILGPRAFELDIPDAWVVTMEVLDTQDHTHGRVL